MKSETKQERNFGLLVGGIFAAIGVWPFFVRGESIRLWAIVLGVLLIAPALLLPKSLGPIYRVWMIVGHALGWLNSRIILAVIYWGLITPMGLAMRLLGKDPLHRKFEFDADSYRVMRQPRPGSKAIRS